MTEKESTIKSKNNAEKHAKSPTEQSVVGVRFKSCGKIYTFKVNGLDVKPGNQVVVDSEMGLNLGHVVTPKHTIQGEKHKLKRVVRIASDKDLEKIEKNKALEDDAKVFCMEKAEELNLPMKVVTTETTLDRKRLIFYFTADGRIDFRELVRDLASKFKTRIEMRQIGVRDEVKLLGGIGACGRQTCCSLFLTSFEPITIRMAKQQELSINQSKLSGVCGRLMCCLSYEFKDKEGFEQDQGDEFITVTDESTEADLLTIDSEKVCAKEVKPPVCKECNLRVTEKTSPQTREGAERKNKFKRRQRRRKKGKARHDKPEQPRQEKTGAPQEKEKQDKDQNNKGRPFSRRRKFWKKKKQQ